MQDSPGGRAVNHWFADGTFTSEWSNADRAGRVSGTWRVAADRRCVTIVTGLPGRANEETCSPIYRRGSRYISVNAQGGIHGIHTLSPIGADER
ncbi:MAG: hypothetical protein KDI16_05205 [Halioglobus sp.]|nr:hypothetical protein [Halioglobus sp.]